MGVSCKRARSRRFLLLADFTSSQVPTPAEANPMLRNTHCNVSCRSALEHRVPSSSTPKLLPAAQTSFTCGPASSRACWNAGSFSTFRMLLQLQADSPRNTSDSSVAHRRGPGGELLGPVVQEIESRLMQTELGVTTQDQVERLLLAELVERGIRKRLNFALPHDRELLRRGPGLRES